MYDQTNTPRPKPDPKQKIEIDVSHAQRLLELVEEFLPAHRARELTDRLPEKRTELETKVRVRHPEEIKKHLDEHIVGNAHAKFVLANAAYNHYLMHGLHFPVDETSRILSTYFSTCRNRENQAQRLIFGLTGLLRENKLNRSRDNPLRKEIDVVLRGALEGEIIRPKELRGEAGKRRQKGEAHLERVSRFIDAACDASKRLEHMAEWGEKQNVLIMGPTGTGKTHLIRRLTSYLNVPFLRLDAAQFSASPYQGQSICEIPAQLLKRAGGNKKLAELGVVFIDEIDKKYVRSDAGSKGDIVGSDVQHSLLTMLEDYQDPETGLNLKGVMFVLGGAFPTLPAIIGRRMGVSQIGFHNSMEFVKEPAMLFPYAQAIDLEKYGMERELVGRVQLTFTEPMDLNALFNVLVHPKGSIFDVHKERLRKNGVELSVTDDGAMRIAALAHSKGTGARGLREIMNLLLADINFNAPHLRHRDSKSSTIELNSKTVEQLWHSSPLNMVQRFQENSMPENLRTII
jgi:ATP-dependent protease Clp ATPase subunit